MNKKFTSILSLMLMIISFQLSGQEITSTTFESAALDGSMHSVHIYTPANYDESAEPYPLYIFLHGCCGHAPESVTSLFEQRLNQLIADGEIDPMLVVFPSAQGAEFGNRHLWTNSVRNGNYGDFVMVDLLTWVEENYNVSTDKRAIGGFSMGGDGALRLGLHNTDEFVAQISHSSYPAIENLPSNIPTVLSETGQTEPSYIFAPNNGLFTEVYFGIASAWSPNLGSPPYEVDFILNGFGEIRTTVFNKWKAVGSPDSIIRTNWSESPQIVPISIYFDIGSQETIFSLYETNNLLNTQFQNLIDEGYTLDYKYNVFNENHTMSIPRVDSSLIWLNNVFENVVIVADETLSNPQVSTINVFPNPANTHLNIDLKEIEDWNNVSVEIITIDGTVLKSFDKVQKELPLYDLKPGTYLFRFKDQEGLVVFKKVIKI